MAVSDIITHFNAKAVSSDEIDITIRSLTLAIRIRIVFNIPIIKSKLKIKQAISI